MNSYRSHKSQKIRVSNKKQHLRKIKTNQKQAYPIDNQLFNKFQKFLTEQRNKEFKKKFSNYCGKNHIVQYLSSYNFLQQWQDNKLHKDQKQFNNILQQNQTYYLVFSFILMIVNIITIWTISVERYFHTKTISQQTKIYFVQMILLTAKVIVNIVLSYKKNLDQSFTLQTIFRHNKTSLFCIGYCLVSSFVDTDIFLMNILEFVVIGVLYQTSAKIYQNLKIMEFGLKYQNQIKILNLFSNIMIEAHILALILYNASKIDKDDNWVKAINIQGKSPISQYIYSFYFASTTMLTIGYGDITPVNIYQIMINVLIQIVGVISFGYLVNEMGHTLSKMRESTEQLERDLQTINKISKYYNLQKDLEKKAKTFVINNQSKSQNLKLEDEDHLLMKLNEDLRQRINHQNSLSVVKSSIFFLCNWSKNMQSLIAQKLQKRLYSPNEKLTFSNGMQRLFLIKSGKIEILMNRYGHTDENKKILKVIDSEKNLQVSDNIYGFTAVFANKKALLQAVAKQFTATFSVNKIELAECVKENKKDFQYYHEIKCRIDQIFHCQQYQTPSIVNIREHYCPSRYIVLKKHNRLLKQCKDKRKTYKRHTKKGYKLIMNIGSKNSGSFSELPQGLTSQKTLYFTMSKGNTSLKALDIVMEQLYEEQKETLEENMLRQYQKPKTCLTQKKLLQQTEPKVLNLRNLGHFFQQVQQYTNFFKKHNIGYILCRLQAVNYMLKKV